MRAADVQRAQRTGWSWAPADPAAAGASGAGGFRFAAQRGRRRPQLHRLAPVQRPPTDGGRKPAATLAQVRTAADVLTDESQRRGAPRYYLPHCQGEAAGVSERSDRCIGLLDLE